MRLIVRMDQLLHNIKIEINDKIFVKNPESSDLGKRIIESSIDLINEIGFEQFNFKKLGQHIGSNESSVYRYFENKHKLLLYLTSWYWGWMEYKLVIATIQMSDPVDKLKVSIRTLTKVINSDSNFTHIDEVKLQNIIIAEYSKSYLTKEVDTENKQGYFSIYKRLVERLTNLIKDVDSSYKFPASLSSCILEGALHQHFIKQHFKALTDCDDHLTPTDFFLNLVSSTLSYSNGKD